MAVVPVLLNIGQSNAGSRPDYATWKERNPGLNVDFYQLSSDFGTGAYNDTMTMPGTWPARHQTIALKGSAIPAIKYLTFFNPGATGLGYTQYPHLAIVEDFSLISGATGLQLNNVWQYNPTGKTIVRTRTQTTHTITAWGGFGADGNKIVVSPAFDPPPNIGEQIEYRVFSGAVSPDTSTVKLDMRFGGNYGNGTWEGSLAGMRLRCVGGTNVGVSRSCDALTLNVSTIVEITTTTAWPSLPQAGDEYVIEPHPLPSGAPVPFKKWGYFLPWSPIEGKSLQAPIAITSFASVPFPGVFAIGFDNSGGYLAINDICVVRATTATGYDGEYRVVEATALGVIVAGTFTSTDTGSIRRIGKTNPYPPGFSYPNHHDQPPLYQPFKWDSFMYGPAAAYESQRAAFHITMASRLNEYLGKTIYVASLAIDGSALGHNELSPVSTISAIGWFDPRQQNYWAPGESNNAYARLLDVLDALKDALALQGDTADIVGITWVQGESDAGALDTANNYGTALRGFKAAVRQAIADRGLCSGDASEIPWLHPQVKDIPFWPYADTVNAAIDQAVELDQYSATVDTDDLTVLPEPNGAVHYDGTSATTLAIRLFDAWREIVESSTVYDDGVVVEDGTGLSTANSYATVAFCNTYFANQGGVLSWTNATASARDTALRRATFWIDQTYGDRFVGLRSVNTQALEWPRSFAYDRQGEDITGVPLALQRATAEIARRYLEDSTQFFADTAAASNILQDSVSVGPISISKTYAGTKDTAKKFVVVDRLFQVAGLIESGGWARR